MAANKLSKTKEAIWMWYYFNIYPYSNELQHAINKWWYIQGLPTKESMLEWYEENYTSNERVHFTSRVNALCPVDLSIRDIVKTSKGIGRVRIIRRNFDRSINSVDVEMLALNNKSKGYWRTFKPHNLTQLFIYHNPSQQYIRLSPKDYAYILFENQEIQYRVTNRKFATLSPECKELNEYVAIFNRQRGGTQILRKLIKAGYVIRKGN